MAPQVLPHLKNAYELNSVAAWSATQRQRLKLNKIAAQLPQSSIATEFVSQKIEALKERADSFFAPKKEEQGALDGLKESCESMRDAMAAFKAELSSTHTPWWQLPFYFLWGIFVPLFRYFVIPALICAMYLFFRGARLLGRGGRGGHAEFDEESDNRFSSLAEEVEPTLEGEEEEDPSGGMVEGEGIVTKIWRPNVTEVRSVPREISDAGYVTILALTLNIPSFAMPRFVVVFQKLEAMIGIGAASEIELLNFINSRGNTRFGFEPEPNTEVDASQADARFSRFLSKQKVRKAIWSRQKAERAEARPDRIQRAEAERAALRAARSAAHKTPEQVDAARLQLKCEALERAEKIARQKNRALPQPSIGRPLKIYLRSRIALNCVPSCVREKQRNSES